MEPQVVGSLIAAAGVIVTLAANVFLLERARRHEKQAVVAAFRSDIRSIVQVLHLMGVVDAFIASVRAPTSVVISPSWVDSPRAEDYFQIFGALSSKIGLTPLTFAREVVRFYTFLHASRDAAAPLGKLREASADGQHVEHARNVLLALSQVLRAAETVLGTEFSQSGTSDGQDVSTTLYNKIDLALDLLNDR